MYLFSETCIPPTFGAILGPSFSFGSCSGAILCLTGEGSRVSCAAGGIRPLSIKLSIPLCASSSVIGGGKSYKYTLTYIFALFNMFYSFKHCVCET